MEEAEKEQIRDRTDIVELISAYTTLKQVGNRFKGLCPFHQEKTPSFTVNPELRRYHCFGCQASGDVFTFLEKKENLTFLEAAERLAQRAGVTLSRRGTNPEEVRRQQSERDRIFAANAAAVRFFQAAYRRATLAQEYAAQRGLVYDTMADFAIGYAPDDWSQLANFLIQREKIHPEDAIRAGLVTASRRSEDEYTDRFRGRLVFPIVDVQERVIGFGGRLIVPKQDAPKYLNSPETPVFSKSKTLYALNRARKAIQEMDVAVIVEGYMDVVAAHQAGIQCVVATLGTAMTAEHVLLLRRYTKNIVLSFDADAAGVKAALKAAELIAGSGTDMTLKVLALPPDEDPDSLIRKGQSAQFRKAIDNAISVPEFRLQSLENQYDVRTDGGRVAFLQEAIAVIAGVSSLITRDVLVRRVARYHPSFSTNSLRAEASIRTEVERAVAQGVGKATETGEEPASGNDTGNSYRQGYSNNGNSYERGGYRSRSGDGYRRPYRHNPPASPSLPDSHLPLAAEEAERTLIRAIFTPEFLPQVQRLLSSATSSLYFTNPLTHALMEALAPATTGKEKPDTILSHMGDEELVSYVDAVLAAPMGLDTERGLELNATMVNDAFRELQMRAIEVESTEKVQILERAKANGGMMTPEDARRLYLLNARKRAK